MYESNKTARRRITKRHILLALIALALGTCLLTAIGISISWGLAQGGEVVSFRPQLDGLDPQLKQRWESEGRTQDEVRKRVLDMSEEVLKNRLRNTRGWVWKLRNGAYWTRVKKLPGENMLQVKFPRGADVESWTRSLLARRNLTFHIVTDKEETENVLRTLDINLENRLIPFLDPPSRGGGPFEVPVGNFNAISALAERANSEPGLLPDNQRLAFGPHPSQGEEGGVQIYLMERNWSMTGEGLKRAQARPNSDNSAHWMILLSFNSIAEGELGELTETNVGRQLGVVLDGRVVSAPSITERISGDAQIGGDFGKLEAQDLAFALNSGFLPAPLEEVPAN